MIYVPLLMWAAGFFQIYSIIILAFHIDKLKNFAIIVS